ncbi:hypothetical protein [Shewanella algae]|uniref:hypothetical protein n=1 Tax=Shewanella algae TaxID=38313 RepID=UPI00168544DC|nr:hypothetical protein [Shewanella algae]MBO2577395.1 hypothetical protein [Shewanella algae]MBO2682960.1 hypothetical protein [Shewanella algae]QNV04952.1 hypothetical protein EIY89_07290 [Shewanella algae]
MNISKLELFSFQLFISIIVISYSWTPIAFFSIPVFVMATFAAIKVKTFNYIFISYVFLILLITYTVQHQVLYIEWARNILFIPLIMVSYILGDWLATNENSVKPIAVCFFISSLIVVLYTFLISIPSDLSLFIGERRGYMAKEYLFFGRFFEFSLGVTHLNLYINFCVVILFMVMINVGLRKIYVLGVLVLVILGLLTQSRSPALFAVIILLIYLIYLFNVTNRKGTYLFLMAFALLSATLAVSPLLLFSDIFSSSRFSAEGMSDVSRLLFFAKGWEHMTSEPWGNSLLYTDPKMPLLNYHNTFLSIGNRIAYLAFYIFIFLFFISFVRIVRINSVRKKFTLLLLLYFCFHNFMIEDVIKFDAFVLFVFFVLAAYVRRITYIEKRFFNARKKDDFAC